MPEKYFSLSGQKRTVNIIEKSRFITTSRHVEGEEEARAFISEIRSEFPDATHNCYAFICDNAGNFLRFSDDGEPQGTAGMPMLDVLKKQSLVQVAAVVTRYFGGIKLGAGGLVRAYSGCVAENVAVAKKVCYTPCAESAYTLEYAGVDAALRYFTAHGGNVVNCDYQSEAIFTVAVKKSEEEGFNSGLLNALNGRVRIKKLREYFFPFEV